MLLKKLYENLIVTFETYKAPITVSTFSVFVINSVKLLSIAFIFKVSSEFMFAKFNFF